MNSTVLAAGMMSGTSLDGLDIAFCLFEQSKGWHYNIIGARTFRYEYSWKKKLASAPLLSAIDLEALDAAFGKFCAESLSEFMKQSNIRPEIICSHGHTVYHQPHLGFTKQIGSGAVIAALTGIDTISDFRSVDVALGGQGAPLVPAGDMMLFSQYQMCLNLGGIANISFEDYGERIAFDICPVNMALNYLSMLGGLEYDKNGALAKSGKIIPALFENLNIIDFYFEPPPKSLGREWFEENFVPHLQITKHSLPDLLHTVTEHIAHEIALAVPAHVKGSMLVTGGGAHNDFLVERIKYYMMQNGIEVIIPDSFTIDFKEALIFAFLGVLRLKGISNTLSSVTGASRNSTGGSLYKGGE